MEGDWVQRNKPCSNFCGEDAEVRVRKVRHIPSVLAALMASDRAVEKHARES